MGAWNDLFAEVARTRYSSLVAYGILLTSNRADAQDLVQDAMIKVFSRVRPLPNAAAADSYIRRAMFTIYLDSTRRRSTATKAQGALVDREHSADAADAAVAGTDVRAALAQLSPQERACVVLRYFDDYTVPRIAEVLGLAEGSVKRYLSDAQSKLGHELAPGHSRAERIPVVPHGGRTYA
jgi:RNA polymerase sigma-70 factor (ECF subfamily)